MKKNTKIVLLLAVILLGVWGAIAYQVIEAISSNTFSETRADRLSLRGRKSSDNLNYIYREDVRDPFSIQRALQSISPKIPKVEARVDIPAPYKLSGILINAKKKIAVIEVQDGSIFFLCEGDTLRGVKLLKIKDRVVTYLYQKLQKSWTLE